MIGTIRTVIILGDQITYSKDLVLSYEDVGANSKITYLLTDIYNSEYWTLTNQ